jgi:hypothetical protein
LVYALAGSPDPAAWKRDLAIPLEQKSKIDAPGASTYYGVRSNDFPWHRPPGQVSRFQRQPFHEIGQVGAQRTKGVK